MGLSVPLIRVACHKAISDGVLQDTVNFLLKFNDNIPTNIGLSVTSSWRDKDPKCTKSFDILFVIKYFKNVRCSFDTRKLFYVDLNFLKFTFRFSSLSLCIRNLIRCERWFFWLLKYEYRFPTSKICQVIGKISFLFSALPEQPNQCSPICPNRISL